MPPPSEQIKILDAVGNESRSLNSGLTCAIREIELIREYRTRLIADVVTGKLDVREAAARLPDEVEEQEPLDETEADTDVDADAADEIDAFPRRPKHDHGHQRTRA